MNFFYVLVLGAALSLDALASGVAYGLKNIAIPLRSLLIVGVITGLCTFISTVFASVLSLVVNAYAASVAGAILLMALGLWSMFIEYLCQDEADNTEARSRDIKISVGRLVIRIMANPEKADMDESHSIGSLEAVFLGLALGVDNMVATFAGELMGILPRYTPLVMAVIQMVFIGVGFYASRSLIPSGMKRHFPYLAGTILLLIGLFRLV